MLNALMPSGTFLDYLIRFILFTTFAIAPMGHLLMQSFRIKLRSRLETVSFSLLAGTIFINTFYFILRWNHLEYLLIPSVALSFVVWFFLIIRDKTVKNALAQVPIETGWFLVSLIILLIYHFHNSLGSALWMPDGSLILTKGGYGDALWKISVISEVEHSVPPEMPILAGHRLAYHYFMELFVVLVHAVTKMDLLNLYFLWVPIFCFLILSLGAFVFFRRIFKNGILGLVAFLTIMVSTGTESFRHAPHVSLSIALFFGCIILISEGLNTQKHGPWFMMAILLGHIMMFESILSLCFLPALGIGSILLLIWKKRIKPLAAVMAGAFIAVGLQIIANGKLGGRGGGALFTLSFPVFQQGVLDFPPALAALKSIRAAWYAGSVSFDDPSFLSQLIRLPFLVVAGVLITLLRNLQLGILGIPYLGKKIRSLRSASTEEILFYLALAMGLIFPLFVGIIYWRGISLRVFNVAGLLLNALGGIIVLRLWQQSFIKKGVVVACVLLLTVIPIAEKTIKSKRAQGFHSHLSSDTMEILNYIRTQTPVDAILLHPFVDDPIFDSTQQNKVAWIYKDHYLYGSAVGGRRVVSEGPIDGVVTAMAKLKDLKAIRSDIKMIYATADPNEAMNLLRKYRVSLLWVPNSEPLHFSSKTLKPLLKNREYTLFQITSEASS